MGVYPIVLTAFVDGTVVASGHYHGISGLSFANVRYARGSKAGLWNLGRVHRGAGVSGMLEYDEFGFVGACPGQSDDGL